MTPQTLRAELRQRYAEIVIKSDLYQEARSNLAEMGHEDQAAQMVADVCEALADAALEVRGIAMAEKKLPPGSSVAWLLAGGATAEEIAAENQAGERERALLMHYEKSMGYGTTLDWWGKDADMVALRKFLVSQTPEDIETFCKWARRPFSKFGPENAKRYPRDVMTFWTLAFGEAENAAPAIPKFIPPADDEKKYVPNPNPRRQW